MLTTQTMRLSSATAAAAATILIGAATPAVAGERDMLSAVWWQNAVSFPVAQNPILDTSGQYCGLGQRGDTWYLYGSFGNPLGEPVERTCTVPTEQKFLVPIVNVICTPFKGETVRDNVKLCEDYIDNVDVKVLKVDGVDRSRLIRRLTVSDLFPISWPADNIMGYPAGVYGSVADGYYALVPELRAGSHTIRIQGAITVYGFTLDVLYHINVVKPGVVVFP
jgi:hypothetical protein